MKIGQMMKSAHKDYNINPKREEEILMKKSKGQTVDLLYTNKKEVKKKANNRTKSKPKGTVKKKKSNTKKTQTSSERINLDNEIIIGLTPKKEELKKKQNSKRENKSNKKVSNAGSQKKNKSNKKKTANQKRDKVNSTGSSKKRKNPKKKKNLKFVKWIIIIILFILAVTLFMMSSIFNIKQIVVINNSKITSGEIISLSKLTTGINMFKTTNRSIRNGIKESAYVEDVKIKRNVNGTVTLDIKERKPTYMLKFENTYVYINNQGYMLEISETSLEVPIITGFSTSNEEIKVGNRLNVDDLNKLDDVIKIIEASKNSPLVNIITEIDITNSFNYKLTIASENKIVQFGDLSNANIKLQMAGKIINEEKDKIGEIYFRENSKKAVFKEQVTR